METIHLELTPDEASILIYALGACYKVPEAWPLAKRVMQLVSHPALPTGAVSLPPRPAESRLPTAVAAPATRPQESENGELTITPVKVEQSGKSMVVTYQIRTGTSTKSKMIRTWDPKLFSDLLATKGVPTTFLVKENSNGFLNIVGVKR